MRNSTATRLSILPIAMLLVTLAACSGRGDDSAESVGASDTEVTIGASVEFSGPASAYATLTHSQEATYNAANASGGITMADGKKRTINFVTYDDGFEPARALDNTRKLIATDKVLAIVGSVGSSTVQAVLDEVDQGKTPLAFYVGSADLAGDPEEVPWAVGMLPAYSLEGEIYAKHILDTSPGAKVAALVEDAANGQDLFRNFGKVLTDHGMSVSESKYDPSVPSVDGNITRLAKTGADVLYITSTPKFAAQAIRKVADIGWKPTIYLASPSSSVQSVLEPAGLDNATGIYSAAWLKDPADPQWANDADVKRYMDVLKTHGRGSLDPDDQLNQVGFTVGEVSMQALEGAEPTRSGFMNAVREMENAHAGLLLPGIDFSLNGTGFGISKMQLLQFDGAKWNAEGDLIGGGDSTK